MRQPASILWVSAVGEKGGAEVYMLNLLRHVDRDRFRPSVVLLRPGPLADDLRQMEVPTYAFSTHRMRNFLAVGKTVLKMSRLIVEQKIDLVHSNGFRAHLYGGLAARKARVPAVWCVHTVEKPGLVTDAILRIPAAHVTANCPRTAIFFVEHRHFTSLIWPSVDEDHLERRTSRTELARRYGLPLEARWISLGARLQRYKGHAFFLRALAALPAEHGNVHGVIIGGMLFGIEPGYADELKALAISLKVDSRVHFTGFIPDADVHGLLAASEFLVHAALDEDFGLIVAEAQALGKPVLAFASAGPAAIIQDGQTGRLVPVGDQTAFGVALRELLAQPEMLRRWGETAQPSISRRFGAPAAAAQLERAYAACLSRPRGFEN
ncbi:MAG: glycosyltransferase family 4 protein [Chloroflexi bacterium]|nr:glycosyltransferase family 4 protein [Chloroflexota bacterium]